ncbi:MAG: phosphodiester glycosidase family protein [Clostridia bacterium]|nr:phosphodiester glycosidase family protein [Clostridia bacterium]
MKKTVSFLLAVLTAVLLFITPSAAVTGQTSSSTEEIYPGVTSTHVTTASGTKYGLQDMKIVTFDPKQEGLSVNVTTGYSSLNSLSTVSNTTARWASSHTDKIPLVAINGDWFTVSYDDYSSATSKKQLYLPLGFNMHGGEIVSTQQTSKESPSASELGNAPSFGVASDGTPLIGCIRTTVTMMFSTKTVYIDGINRLPSDNCLIMYTDKGPSSNYCLDDAYEIYVDFDTDYTVKDGMRVVGTVTGVSAPGEARQAIKANRMILTARGTRIDDVSSIPVGKKIRFDVSIEDAYGRTEQWKTVTDCVGGHHEFCRDGTYFNIGDSTNYPANVIGITAEGKVILLCNDGRQSGYSVGVSINKMADLAKELGIVSGIYMDGGGSTTMLQRNSSGSMELVNRPCNTGNAERSVGNALILACDVPQVDDFTFDSTAYASFIGYANSATGEITDNGFHIVTTATAYDPFIYLQNFNLSADEYKYIAFDVKTDYRNSISQRVGLYLAAGATQNSTESCKASFSFAADTRSHKVFVDLTSLSLWEGAIHNIRIDTFDDMQGVAEGRGVYIREMKFCKTLEEAEYFVYYYPGDVDRSGKINTQDISAMKKYIASVYTDDDVYIYNSDLNGDGKVNTRDLSALKRLIAS